ncbi:MAG: septal ring lytic transglycosylase RlpA family protein [Deltaproteobacteria bacterium]|nr:septal ring lytic transglycosylase RlpA family protein [Deltaproteobacteria bacterium]
MVSLIPGLEEAQAYLRSAPRSSQEDFAQLLKTVSRGVGSSLPPEPPRYVVQRGDNLSAIAKKFGCQDPYALAQANGLKNPDLLHPGQVLQLPEGSSGAVQAAPQAPAVVRPRVRQVAGAPEAQPTARGASRKAAPAAVPGQVVVASWYGPRHHGRLMANGQPFNMYADTVAHPSLPFGTKLRLTNPDNGRSVEVRVTDRGPYIKGRGIDLSYGVAQKLGMVNAGVKRLLMQKS